MLMGVLTKRCIAFVLVFTLISFFSHGYSYGLGDQVIHLPLIKKITNPALYQQDLLFLPNQSDFSLFYLGIALVAKITPLTLETIFLIGYLVTTLLFFLSIFLIGKKFLGGNIWSIALLGSFFLLPFPIGGSAIYSIDTSLVPRWIAFVLSIIGLYLLVSGRHLQLSLLAPIIFAIHPLNFLQLALISIFYLFLLRRKIKAKYMGLFIVSFIIVNFPILRAIWLQLVLRSFVKSSPGNWLAVLRERNPYAFLDLWRFKAWLALGLVIIPILIYLVGQRRKRNSLYWLITAIFFATMSASIFQYLLATVLPTPFIISLQLSRIWVFGFFAAALVLVKLISTPKFIDKKYILGSILIIVLYLSVAWKGIYLRQNQTWIDTQMWAKKHTSKDCTFLTPFYLQGFRIYSERSSVAELKDGTLSFYSPVFASLWHERKRDLENWERLLLADLEALQKKYKFSFFVLAENWQFFSNPIYQNHDFAIYQMSRREVGCEIN